MLFLISPLKLVNVLKSGALIDEATKKPEEWYLSAKGKEEHDRADTLPKKTEYYYNYLLSLNSHNFENYKYKNDFDNLMFKLGYIMAHSVDGSSLPFANYPDILDEEKNPLVNYAKNDADDSENAELSALDEMYRAGNLLAELCDKLKKDKKDEYYRDYKQLEKPDCDGNVSDLYKLERDIIWIFQLDGKLFPYEMGSEKIAAEILMNEKDTKKLKKTLEEEN